jgi:Tfp pilus assembly protein PilF
MSSNPADKFEGARQALALAPDYADAHRVLALFLSSEVYFGVAQGSPTAVLREARKHADRAVELDPTDGLAYLARASVRFVGGESDGAETDYRQALALAPGSAEVHHGWSWYLSSFGRYDECVAAGERGEAMNPLTPSESSGWCLFTAGRYAEAAARLETTLVARGGGASALLAASYARAGQVDKARALRDETRKTVPPGQSTAVDWWLMYVELAEGDRAGALRLAELWWNTRPKSAMLWLFVAQMYGALDDADRVFESAGRGISQCGNPDPCAGGAAAIEQFLREPSLFSERVRNDPRTLGLIRKVRAGK